MDTCFPGVRHSPSRGGDERSGFSNARPVSGIAHSPARSCRRPCRQRPWTPTIIRSAGWESWSTGARGARPGVRPDARRASVSNSTTTNCSSGSWTCASTSPAFDATTFRKNWTRLSAHAVVDEFFVAVAHGPRPSAADDNSAAEARTCARLRSPPRLQPHPRHRPRPATSTRVNSTVARRSPTGDRPP